MKTLHASGSRLSDTGAQLELLAGVSEKHRSFAQSLAAAALYPLKATALEVLQVNVGKQCNQTCRHCHVDAGPDRREMMQPETLQLCLDALRQNPSITTVDITGGAPEMHPQFRWFVEEISKLGRKMIVRCNLTIIVANKKYHDLPQFYRAHGMEVISSLPYYSSSRTDAQRGEGVFERSVQALKMLNEAGYGREPGLALNLVYNPSGAFLPAAQPLLEQEFKSKLMAQHGIMFNNLYTITNMPVSRFLDYLVSSGHYETYMERLVNAFNPAAAAGVMCRNMISVSYDGHLYDCDFNQMLDLKVEGHGKTHLTGFDAGFLQQRNIVVRDHCYGCTAGAGSSCGGTTA